MPCCYSGSMRGHIISGLAATGLLFASQAALAGTTSASARSLVRQPTTLANTQRLDFGRVIRGTTAGTVTINARTGARTRTGGTVLLGTTGFSNALFTGTAAGGVLVRLTVGAPTITLTNTSGPGTMTVNTLRVSIGTGGQQTLPRNTTMPASGTQTFRIGGRLNVAANQPAGFYTGSFALTLNYQ